MSSKPPRRKIQVRNSGVHGKGVYAVAPIEAGTKIIEYTGERISWQEAQDRHPHDPAHPNHTFYFSLDSGEVIDALYGGNNARWINHSCEPNCEAEETDAGRVYIRALRDIEPGEELFYDYGLVLDERYTAKLKKEFACFCGTATCRGTLLAPKR
ncbi:SET domain-containing protein [Roseateles paludis]|uniref:SET domain-containing protein-lysine N-methyltransferase n=1 Tax=Roseateles paludis TaxID=3145238 RepID=A0ABV0FWF4_9BURK